MKSLAALALLSLTTAAHARPTLVTDDRLHLLDHRRFVLTEEDAPANVKLHLLEPMTYDGTSVADATDLEAPRTFTVLSANGSSCHADATRRMFVRSMLAPRATKVAIDLDGACKADRALLVIDGATDATADAITAESRRASASDVRWFERTVGDAAQRTFEHEPMVWIQDLPHGISLVSGHHGDHAELVVRRSGRALDRIVDGTPIAILHDHGDRLVVKTPGGLRTVTLATS